MFAQLQTLDFTTPLSTFDPPLRLTAWQTHFVSESMAGALLSDQVFSLLDSDTLYLHKSAYVSDVRSDGRSCSHLCVTVSRSGKAADAVTLSREFTAKKGF